MRLRDRGGRRAGTATSRSPASRARSSSAATAADALRHRVARHGLDTRCAPRDAEDALLGGARPPRPSSTSSRSSPSATSSPPDDVHASSRVPDAASARISSNARVARRPGGGRAWLSTSTTITVTVNGRRYRGRVEARKTLADFLREDCALTGTHLGLRARRLRRVHGAARRRGRALVPAVRGAGRRRRGHDGRGPRRGRRRALDRAGRVPRRSTVCSAGSARPGFVVIGHRVARREPGARPTTRSARRCRATCAAAPATRGSSTRSASPPRRGSERRAVTSDGPTAGRFVGQSVKRARGSAPADRARGRTSTTWSCRACCTRAFVRSDLARGRITRLDVDAAARARRRHAVLTAADLNPAPARCSRRCS